MGKLIGYARVSTRSQGADRQVTDLLGAGVRRDDRVCPLNGVWGPAVLISEWFFRTVRRR